MGKRRQRATQPPADRPRNPAHPSAGPAARAGWFHGKRPILQAVLVFALCMLAFYGATATTLFQDTIFPAYLRWNAAASARILTWFGEDAAAHGTTLASPRFSLEIKRGCDAVEPSALYITAVLISPVAIYARLIGIVVGTVALMLVNLLRIVTLYYVGVFHPRAFETVHLDVWQALFILLALFFWLIWARWAKRPASGKADART